MLSKKRISELDKLYGLIEEELNPPPPPPEPPVVPVVPVVPIYIKPPICNHEVQEVRRSPKSKRYFKQCMLCGIFVNQYPAADAETEAIEAGLNEVPLADMTLPARIRIAAEKIEHDKYLEIARNYRDKYKKDIPKPMPYADYLQTEHWKKISEECKKLADYRCMLCNKGGTLDAHHRTYERLGSELMTDIICLCRDCHNKHHGKTQIKTSEMTYKEDAVLNILALTENIWKYYDNYQK
jgi:hypothetical protein